MNARKKLNALYAVVAALVAAYAGLMFNTWLAFGIAFAAIMAFNLQAGNTRPAPGRRSSAGARPPRRLARR